MYRVLILFSVFLISTVVLGHGDEDHRDPKTSQEVSLDEDGFEIISSGPSKDVLNQINEAYKKDVKSIFSNKCLACHGVNNSMPWYYSIPGAKQLMDHDMKEAKEHMDMSNDFPFAGHGRPLDDLDALKKTIDKGNMPPFQYKIIHWKSGLSDKEKKIIKKWIQESKDLIGSK
ncbi:MAG: hypothetical protein COW01_15815 [Bdellovibrionales bacterium CG12_big_fil_rev_8_21_14_0_65_38_15]|nr:MAG: hypothetical protein COW79_14980 [Bdellovibrionales bacterium CG22_combo_CG10-13_8_21_14_all_38_13]PIQ52435.1 MAG: hypothetical protein COW01_15815 [Bdellovibrionales bacterium CG12_big_fil_rev_8_21_14_0_65_38_15]PIR29473.1 MAG: hypothetical protein COV38_10355 [Bdellovibrionales bacterium CG11_big_fil_rev_8_21_14_0_20_38_13]